MDCEASQAMNCLGPHGIHEADATTSPELFGLDIWYEENQQELIVRRLLKWVCADLKP